VSVVESDSVDAVELALLHKQRQESLRFLVANQQRLNPCIGALDREYVVRFEWDNVRRACERLVGGRR
jgi:hypothetical protein